MIFDNEQADVFVLRYSITVVLNVYKGGISMSKRLFNRVFCVAVLLILTFLLIFASLCTIKAQAAEISPGVNTWSALQDAIANAGSGDMIVLNSDVTAAESDIALSIPDGTVLSLDLNGHTIRFPNIRVEYDIRDEECCVPALTIQPLVENAIRHGVRSRKEGVVRVAAYREGNEHLIVI